jgi:hypothetical protein
MKKVWPIVSAFLTGVIAGIILWEKMDYKAIYKGRVKIKQKGEGHTLDSDIVISVKEARQMKRERRKAKRDERKKQR